MKLSAFRKYLRNNGCRLVREGAKHSWWENPESKKRSSVPRHSEIEDNIAYKICKDLGIRRPEHKT